MLMTTTNTDKEHEALKGKVTYPRSPDSKRQTHNLYLGDLTPESILFKNKEYIFIDFLEGERKTHISM